MQVVDKLTNSRKWIVLWIKREYPSVLHIIDVSPHHFKWNFCLCVVVYNLSHLIDVTIAISALMETKAPIRHHDGQSNNLGVLLTRLDRSWPIEEVEVKDPTQDIVLEVLSISLCVVDLDFYSI